MIEGVQKANYLLDQIKTVRDTYRLIEKGTGQNFNLFSILNMETAEVKTHSRFLAELLDPNGSHDQGGKFLGLFVDYLNELEDESGNPFLVQSITISSKQAKVEIERYIGRITDTDGGRIDISISDNHNIIVIENKIYASEAHRQMLRYTNFASSIKRNNHVFFLTLEGGRPTTTEGVGQVYSISYRKHILEWLEICKKESVDLPILRESIAQYINLIKKLTYQTSNKEMESDVQSLILKYAKEAELVANNYNQTLLNLADHMVTSTAFKIEDYLSQNELSDIWEISLKERVEGAGNRGMIWLRPKIANDNNWIIGIEDFNPLFRDSNFEKKIFAGIRSETQSLNYVNTLDRQWIQSCGSWNDYIFMSEYKNQEVRLDNDKLLRLLAEEGEIDLFCEHILSDFISYFKIHAVQLLDFIRKNN